VLYSSLSIYLSSHLFLHTANSQDFEMSDSSYHTASLLGRA